MTQPSSSHQPAATGATRLEFEVHLCDGNANTFIQTNEADNAEHLARLDPHNIFASPWMGFDSSRGVTVFPADSIAHLIMRLEPLPAWAGGMNDAHGDLREISRERFDELLSPENESNLLRTQDRTRTHQPGDRLEGVAVVTMQGGDEIMLHILREIAPVLEQRMLVDAIFKRKSIFFPCEGGVHFINVSKITRIHVMPGQPHLAPNAWRTEPAES